MQEQSSDNWVVQMEARIRQAEELCLAYVADMMRPSRTKVTGAELRAGLHNMVSQRKLERGLPRNAFNVDAAHYVVSLCDESAWALFPEEICKEYVEELTKVYNSQCYCQKQPHDIIQAISNRCLRCCASFLYQAGRSVRGVFALMSVVLNHLMDFTKLLRFREAGLQDNHGVTALMLASSYGCLEEAKLLMNKEAGLQDEKGATALMRAAEEGRVDIVRLLAPKEARMQESNGWTALMQAGKNSHVKCVQILAPLEHGIKNGQNVSALMLATATNNLETARILAPLENRLSDVNGQTALHTAANNGFTRLVELLLPFEEGITTTDGMTALMFAAQCGCTDAVRLLASHEAGVRDSCGWTALMNAVQFGAVECAKVLVEREARVQDNDGTTALMLAAQLGHLELVQLLAPLEAGLRQTDGRTALIMAGLKGHRAVVQVLVQYEAGITTPGGWTALSASALTFQQESFSVLYQSQIEREEAQLPAVIEAAYSGNLQQLISLRDKWNILYLDCLTVPGFAVLGGITRALRTLLPETKPLSAFCQQDYSEFSRHAERFPRELYRWVAAILAAQYHNEGSEALRIALEGDGGKEDVEKEREETQKKEAWLRTIRCICMLVPKDLQEALEKVGEERVVKHARNLGLLLDGKAVAERVSAGPLKEKQIQLARKQAAAPYPKRTWVTDIEDDDLGGEGLPVIQQLGYREQCAEIWFNQLIFQGSREAFFQTGATTWREPLVATETANCIASKLRRAITIQREAWAFLFRKVQEMLDD